MMMMMILQTCSRQDFQEGGQVLLQVPAAEQVSAQEPAEGRRQGGHREGDQRPVTRINLGNFHPPDQ